MKQLLILLTNGFPYGTEESFLEAEYPLYRDYFDHVLISTACKRGEQPTRKLSKEAFDLLPDYTLSKDRRSFFEALPWLLTDKAFYHELWKLFLGGSFSLKKLHHLLAYALCGNHRARAIYRWLKAHSEYDELIWYSYWMHIPAYAGERLNRKLGKHCFAITRAHGGDLYLDRGVEGYQPFHEHLYRHLDEIAVISEHGRRYLTEHYGESSKVKVFRLGAVDCGVCNPYVGREVFHIVTCSRTVPLKRLDRLVDALCLLTDHPIHWTHLGDGETQEKLKNYAREKLPANVSVDYYGMVPNEEVYEVMGTQPFHVFVNVSSTEGIPVSIMEAMSFYIPIIATDVGGTAEIVDNGRSGILLPVDFSNDQLADAIRRFIAMPEEQYVQYRKNAREQYAQRYDATKNHREFLNHLKSIQLNPAKNHALTHKENGK